MKDDQPQYDHTRITRKESAQWAKQIRAALRAAVGKPPLSAAPGADESSDSSASPKQG